MSLDVSLYFDECEHCGQSSEVFSANITHNLANMADAAGIYGAVWRPDENGYETAGELIEPLTRGIAAMKADPKSFKKLNSSNGWGLYESFLPWLEKYLDACVKYPKAQISVSR